MTRRGWALFGAMCVIWGVPYLLIKVAVGAVTPATLVFLRTALGGLLLLPFAIRSGSLLPLLPRWRPVLVYTAVEVAIPWLLLSDAERRLSSSLSGLLVAAVPMVGVALARLTGTSERLDARRLLGLVVGLVGVGVLLGFDVGAGDAGAVAEIGLVTVGYATGPMLISRNLAALPPNGVVVASLLITAVVYAPLFVLQRPASMPSERALAAIVALAVACTGLAFLLFFALIAEAGPLRATVITYVNPAVAVALGVLLLGERFTLSTAAGFALILLGCFFATRRTRARGTSAPVPSALAAPPLAREALVGAPAASPYWSAAEAEQACSASTPDG